MQLSRYRCFACIFVFLAADMINLNFYPAGKASWIAVFLASLLALPFYRLCTFACSRVLGKRGAVLFPVYISWVFLTVSSAGALLDRFRLFIVTYNSFALSPWSISFLLAATALFMALLKGHGLERYIEAAFACMSLFFVVLFVVSAGNWQLQRLLPVFEEEGLLEGILKAFARPFSQGLAAIALLSGRASEKNIRQGAYMAALASGLLLSMEYIKNISVAGFNIASKYTFPAYAVAGLQRLGSYGIHTEDLLICALVAASIIKLALLYRLAGYSVSALFGRWQQNRWVSVVSAVFSFASAVTLFGSESACLSWLELSLRPVGWAMTISAGLIWIYAKSVGKSI